jgi:hypothetical protein
MEPPKNDEYKANNENVEVETKRCKFPPWKVLLISPALSYATYAYEAGRREV